MTPVDGILARYGQRTVSAEVAVAQLLMALGSVANVRHVIRDRGLAALERLLEDNVEGCARVEAMLDADLLTGVHLHRSCEETVAHVARMFDAYVQRSEEASVALYSLGSADRLAAATAEIVQLFATRGWLGSARRALDVGCGIGRVASGLAAHLHGIDGVDVSSAMIEAAKRRCAQHRNVRLVLGSGIDLAPWPDAHFDLVYAVDSFPYVVAAGAGLATRYFAEMARVVAPGGQLVVLNWSYRGDTEADRRDAAELAACHRLTLGTASTCPFALWDGLEFSFLRAR